MANSLRSAIFFLLITGTYSTFTVLNFISFFFLLMVATDGTPLELKTLSSSALIVFPEGFFCRSRCSRIIRTISSQVSCVYPLGRPGAHWFSVVPILSIFL